MDTAAWSRLLAQADACDDYTEMIALCHRLKALERGGRPEGMTPLRLAVLGGATTEMLVEPLRLALAARGIAAEIFAAAYNQFIPEMLDPASETVRFRPQAAVVVNTPHNIAEWPAAEASAEEAGALAQRVCGQFLEPCRLLHERTGCEIALNNFHPFPARPAGNLGAKLPGDPDNFIRRLNTTLGDRAPAYVHLNDVASMAQRRGLDRWLDLRYWYAAKQPVSYECAPEYVRNTAALLGALFGRSKKCLVLDLDNTLWGGVIGDDGLEGIELGEGSPAGEAFKAFQLYVRALRERGVLLAVCSKNDEGNAGLPFERHPEMALRRDDFAAFKANWQPKSQNLEAIAAELNIGLDSLVFVDDNPAEREQVRQALPEVAVPEMTDEPADYPAILDNARYFEAATLTADDRRRTETYRQRQAASELRAGAADLTEYLKSLEMIATVAPIGDASIERATQLINKSNQFNLTTRRLTLSEVRAIAADPGRITRTVRLRDRFGDHGLISVLIAKVERGAVVVEDWLMSCRALNRGVERLLLNELIGAVRETGAQQIVGVYLPTAKNGLVKNHYRDLGFECVEDVAGWSEWRLNAAEAQPLSTFIELSEEPRWLTTQTSGAN